MNKSRPIQVISKLVTSDRLLMHVSWSSFHQGGEILVAVSSLWKDTSGSHLGFFCRLSAAQSIVWGGQKLCNACFSSVSHRSRHVKTTDTQKRRGKSCANVRLGWRRVYVPTCFFIEVQSCLLLRLRSLHAEEAEEPGSRLSTVDRRGENMTRSCKYSAQDWWHTLHEALCKSYKCFLWVPLGI